MKQLKPENKAFLDEHRHIHTTLVKAQYMMGLSGPIRSGMVRVIQEEFQPGYATDLWCPPCVSAMVLLLYRYYDEWLEKQAEEPTPIDDPHVQHAEHPIQTRANFPSHKQNHRRR